MRQRIDYGDTFAVHFKGRVLILLDVCPGIDFEKHIPSQYKTIKGLIN